MDASSAWAITTREFPTPAGGWIFRSAPPPPDLAHVALQFWESIGREPFAEEAVIPRNSVELMINLGEPFWVVDAASGERRLFKAAWLAGLHDGAIRIVPAFDTAASPTHLVCIQLTVTSAREIVQLPMIDVANRVVELEDILERETAPLRERLLNAETPAERFAHMLAFARARADRARFAASPAVLEAAGRMTDHAGGVGIGDICADLGISRQRLAERFADEIGLGPKRYARLLRFRAAIDAMSVADMPPLAQVAAEAGYFDQAHFTRDFKAFAGASPKTFLAERGIDGESLIYY
jgi:AraC-like DNA-binding protein